MRIEGGVSVKAAMLGGKRTVETIWLDESRHDKDAHFIEQKAKELSIEVKKCSREEIESMAEGRTHGGILAEVSERNYDDLSSALDCEKPFLVLLEGVEDPFNLGYIMRTLYSAGCTGILLRQRDWSFSEPVILKSSAGASEYLNTILTNEPDEILKLCHKHGLKVYAAMRKDAITYLEGTYDEPVVLCIGGEMRGLSSKVLKECDQNIYIPYANDFRNALNAAGAAAVLAFEVYRQRL